MKNSGSVAWVILAVVAVAAVMYYLSRKVTTPTATTPTTGITPEPTSITLTTADLGKALINTKFDLVE